MSSRRGNGEKSIGMSEVCRNCGLAFVVDARGHDYTSSVEHPICTWIMHRTSQVINRRAPEPASRNTDCMALRIALNWVVLCALLALLLGGLGGRLGSVELAVLGVLFLAIGVFRTRQIWSQRG